MEKLLTRRDINCAADLLTMLTELQSQGFDLSVMWVRPSQEGPADEVTEAGVTQTTLTDGSKTFDLILYIGD